ncbi:MAG: guanylate kinase [Hymenobacter sp.]|nr:MAG: guanylate kinase [Hymenobacter sp.]
MLRTNTEFLSYIDVLYQGNQSEVSLQSFEKDSLLLRQGENSYRVFVIKEGIAKCFFLEENGKDYYFLTPDDFKHKIDADEFVEWEEVYTGAFYGTLKSEIQRLWDSGKHVLFDVDVQGGLKLKHYYGDKALAVFVKVPDEETLRQRLIGRGSETDESLSKRLFKVHFEMSFQDQFDTILVNDDLETSLKKAQQLVDNFVQRDEVPEKGAVL